jgi:hypothetical protein
LQQRVTRPAKQNAGFAGKPIGGGIVIIASNRDGCMAIYSAKIICSVIIS